MANAKVGISLQSLRDRLGVMPQADPDGFTLLDIVVPVVVAPGGEGLNVTVATAPTEYDLAKTGAVTAPAALTNIASILNDGFSPGVPNAPIINQRMDVLIQVGAGEANRWNINVPNPLATGSVIYSIWAPANQMVQFGPFRYKIFSLPAAGGNVFLAQNVLAGGAGIVYIANILYTPPVPI